jgi:hypothetical protein
MDIEFELTDYFWKILRETFRLTSFSVPKKQINLERTIEKVRDLVDTVEYDEAELQEFGKHIILI